MVQTDYIMRIIEQFAAILWAIIFNKKAQNYDLALEKINEAYNGLLHFNPEEIKNLDYNEIIEKNTFNAILDMDNIEIIATLLFQEADILERIDGTNKISLKYYEKSIKLFLILFNGANKYCQNNIEEIIAKLENYETENEIIFKLYEYFLKSGTYGKAEDKLYNLRENNYPNIKNEIETFYKKLLEKDDIVLEKGNLPRKEIIEAIKELY
jgi:hypothetical protein